MFAPASPLLPTPVTPSRVPQVAAAISVLCAICGLFALWQPALPTEGLELFVAPRVAPTYQATRVAGGGAQWSGYPVPSHPQQMAGALPSYRPATTYESQGAFNVNKAAVQTPTWTQNWLLAALAAVPLLSVLGFAVQRVMQPTADHAAGDLEAPLAMASASGTSSSRVVVTGGGGRTGKLVVEKLMNMPDFSPVAIVKSEKSIKTLQKMGLKGFSIKNVSVMEDPAVLAEAMKGCDSLIICTSAVPRIQPFSIVKILLAKIFCQTPGRPTFTFAENGTPEEVDWVGQKNQIDAAKAAGIKHVVVVSSMGGTQPDNFLNTIGKQEDGTGGDILLWKRKAEQYLIESGLPYTIIHPGGLLDQEGGQREIVFGVDDQLLKEEVRSIPRADVAEVCVRALQEPGAINRSIDIISRSPGEGTITTDFAAFFAQEGNCDYSK